MAFLENTQNLIIEIAKIAQIPGDVLARLKEPEKVLEFEVPVRMDDGSEQKFMAWRVQHSSVLGPHKGGIRYHPDSTLEEVKALASLMTWKTSLAGLPYGGSKGAVKVDPKKLNKKELEELSRGYVRAIWKEIGPRKDIPAPDVNTNAEIMDWMVDEYARILEQSGEAAPTPLIQARAGFTGKSVAKGGSQGREIATGFGGYVILREFLKMVQGSGFPPAPGLWRAGKFQDFSVAIQGFGNVGSNIAKILFDKGFKICAISDSKGALYEEHGIDINKVLEVKEKTGIIDRDRCYGREAHKEPCRHFSNEELLEANVDILIPAALENQITRENAGKIKAKVILEMANGPVTRDADKILEERGIAVIPDILANGGGVVGSYFEWVQSLENNYWSEEEVLKKIDEKLTEVFREVKTAKERYRTTWRLASYLKAILRVASAMKNDRIAVRKMAEEDGG